MKRSFAVLCLALILTSIAFADEGMWLFNKAPKAKIQKTYGFAVTDQWLEHVQKSSVRFNSGGSGSFVSANGLAFTNHHVAQSCLEQIATAEHDYMKTGFYAKTNAEELKCPDIELNVLMGIEDVTSKVQEAVKLGMSPAQVGAAQRAVQSQIEADCNKSTGLRCDVVTFYSGAVYNLYRYKKYNDVRLVFAPEFPIAFFGGDPDNFEYPRYDLDIAFFRAYENDKPVSLDHYFKWSAKGVGDNELVFVSGHPGSTGKLLTMAQLGFLRDVQYPFELAVNSHRIQLLQEWSKKSEENARRAQHDIFGMQNNQKRNQVYHDSLTEQALMSKKEAEENKYKQAVASDPKKKQEFGDPWADVAGAMNAEKEIYVPYMLLERRYAFRGDLSRFARDLVRAAAERQKPNGERLREYRESALAPLQNTLFASTPIYKDLETVVLTDSLSMLQQKLPNDDATKKILNGRSPEQVANDLISGTKLDDPAVRKQLYEGGTQAIASSTDPLIVLMRNIDPDARALRKQYDDKVDAVERTSGATIAKIRFAQEGFSVPPDATFTLRLSYGKTAGYTEDGRGTVPAGTKLPYFTTIGGAFDHAAKHPNNPDYALPDSWLKAKQSSKLKLQTPLDNVSTPEIIGGSSGSPVINKQAEIIGIIFDSNMQALPWRYVYDDKLGRSVSVDSRGIIEALRDVYGATALADELSGGGASASAKAGVTTRAVDHQKAKTMSAAPSTPKK